MSSIQDTQCISSRRRLPLGFLKFTEPTTACRETSQRCQGIVMLDKKVAAAMDRWCKNNGDADAKADSGIFYGRDNPRNMAILLPEMLPQSNNAGELVLPYVCRENPFYSPQ